MSHDPNGDAAIRKEVRNAASTPLAAMQASRVDVKSLPDRGSSSRDEKIGERAMASEVELKLELSPDAVDRVTRLPWLRELTQGPAKREN